MERTWGSDESACFQKTHCYTLGLTPPAANAILAAPGHLYLALEGLSKKLRLLNQSFRHFRVDEVDVAYPSVLINHPLCLADLRARTERIVSHCPAALSLLLPCACAASNSLLP